MNEYRYTLDKESHKDYCPQCNEKRFVRYIDIMTDEYLPEQYGRCDREESCQYHLNPYQDGFHLKRNKSNSLFSSKTNISKELTPYPIEVLVNTQNNYESNTFIQNLLNNVSYPFTHLDIEKIISLYHLGTIKDGFMYGAVTFPFIDKSKIVRAIQAKRFNSSNHTLTTNWVHSLIEKQSTKEKKPIPQWIKDYKSNQSKVSCLFGEHLLAKYPSNTIALVEAPKTALYCTLYLGFPEVSSNLLWLAVGSLSSLNYKKCKALKGRNVILFPDSSQNGYAFNEWSKKAKTLKGLIKGSNFKISNLLEQFVPIDEKIKGYDLADYLIQQDWRKFRVTEL